MDQPQTHPSLLIRIRDAADQEAWCEFTDIYRPVIVRLARRRGMQDADAEDLAQQVLVAVSVAIKRWENDRSRGKFRTWLRRVTENAVLNALTRGVSDRASGDSGMRELIDREPAPNGPDSDLIRHESRREIFCWSARRIENEFHRTTWRAFWMSTVEGRPISEVARTLGQSCGAVYAARSRVMRRLKEKVREFDQDTLEWEC